MSYYTKVRSPIGSLTLMSNGGGLTGLYMRCDTAHGKRDAAPFKAAIEQLDAYWAHELTKFDLELAPEGTPFQKRVWRALRRIPYGGTVSYGTIAKRVGSPRAVRAVGRANGSNPISIVVPCHRVIGANGTLTGYGGGIDNKRFLLQHEGVETP